MRQRRSPTWAVRSHRSSRLRRRAASTARFPDLPPAERQLDIGRSESPDAALAWSQAPPRRSPTPDFELNLFPVADVATLDSPLAGRAFSDDPAQVAVLTEEAIQGCEDAGLACAPLHFPGLGSGLAGHRPMARRRSPLRSKFSATATWCRSALWPTQAPAMVLSLGLYPDFDAAIPGP